MMRTIFLLLLLLTLFTAVSQPGPAFTLKGEIENFQRPETFYLLSVRGSGMQVVDSMHSDNGRFLFIADSIPPTGEYVIFWGDNYQLPLIIAGEKYIEIHADELEPTLSPKCIASTENEIYFLFKSIEYKIDSLIYLGDYYYSKNMFNKLVDIQKEITRLEKKAMLKADSIAKIHPGSFALKIFRGSIPPDFYTYQKEHPDHGFESETDFLRRHYFDNIDKNDSNLVRTSVIYDACSFYIRNLTAEKTTEGYIKSSNFIISNFAANDAQFNYVVELLLNTFEAANMGDVYIYLFDTYMKTCHNGIPSEHERKALAFKNLKKGNPAPNLVAPDRNGTMHSLSDYIGKVIILVFWAGTCPHCEEILPHVVDYVVNLNNPELVLMSYSVDTDEDEWINGLLRNEIPEPALSDLQGFDGENALNWHIWATPTFFIIDRNGLIYSKPMTLSQLEKAVRELL